MANWRLPAYVLLLGLAIAIGLGLRAIPLERLDDRYLVGVDSYRLVRQCKQVLADGRLPERRP